MSRVFVLPVIRREDYAAFRRDVGAALPDTYEQWSLLLAREVASSKREGKAIVEVEIDYSRYLQYCMAFGYSVNAVTLLNFARSKPLGEA